jgi:hypothetical protein
MSRQTIRHLHLGCGESLCAALPTVIRELRKTQERKTRDARSKKRLEKLAKDKEA